MKRREFILLLGGAAVAWPLGVRAQQSGMPRIGLLHSASPLYMDGFRQGLRDEGFIEGHNILIESRAANGAYQRWLCRLFRWCFRWGATPSVTASLKA
jgi:putative ABC transport system substrate-binding protein